MIDRAQRIIVADVLSIFCAGQGDAAFLMALVEGPSESSREGECVQYGVCYVDTATGEVNLGQFGDDRQR